MRFIFLISFAIAIPFVAVHAQDIVAGEYFFNTDPGYGNGSSISIPSPGQDISIGFTITELGGLVDGMNSVYFRFRDSDGKWSLNAKHIFIKQSITQQEKAIDYLEYFFDQDPGKGLANPVNINSSGHDIAVDFTADIVNISDGIHSFYLRSRNKFGNWSHLARRIFIKQTPKGAARDINYLEYYIGEDPGIGNGIQVPVTTPQNEITIDFTADLENLNPGFHTIGFRSRNAYGIWSKTAERIFFLKANALSNIEKIEYFFTNNNFRSETIYAPVATPATSVDLDFLADISSLTAGESYLIHVVAVTEGGEKSEVAIRSFEVSLEVTSISEEAKMQVRVYPNPTSEKLQIQFDHVQPNTVDIDLMDESGRMINRIRENVDYVGDNGVIIDMESLSNGLYFLKVHSESGTNIYKVIKK